MKISRIHKWIIEDLYLNVKMCIESDLNKKGKIETLRCKAYIKFENVIFSYGRIKLN